MGVKLSKKIISLLASFAVLILAAFGFYSLNASAEDNGSCSLLCKTTDDIILEGMHWDIYKVGICDQYGNYILTGDFADYPVSLKNTSASAIADASKTLENYAKIDKIASVASGNADKNGYLAFDGLESGLYLMSGRPLQIGMVTYYPSAFLVNIYSGTETVDMTVYPKYTSIVSSDEMEKYTLKKIWENDTEQDRSEYITAEIYCDNELYQTVKLDSSNDWTYTWSVTVVEDEIHEWTVIERDVPQGYTVVYRSNNTQFAIVNTLEKDEPVTTTTAVTTQKTESYTTTEIIVQEETKVYTTTEEKIQETKTTKVTKHTDATYTKTKTENTKVTTTTRKLPQTGQLWWPVPVLALAGLVLVAIGLRLRKKD